MRQKTVWLRPTAGKHEWPAGGLSNAGADEVGHQPVSVRGRYSMGFMSPPAVPLSCSLCSLSRRALSLSR